MEKQLGLLAWFKLVLNYYSLKSRKKQLLVKLPVGFLSCTDNLFG
jgi:hypothetical protein